MTTATETTATMTTATETTAAGSEGPFRRWGCLLPNICWLVVWNIFYFPYIGNVIIPTDFHIFQRGRYTTNQIKSILLRVETMTLSIPPAILYELHQYLVEFFENASRFMQRALPRIMDGSNSSSIINIHIHSEFANNVSDKLNWLDHVLSGG